MFISGRTQRCNTAIFDDEEFDFVDANKHVIGNCGSTEFELVGERYNADEGCFLGEEKCSKCGSTYLFSRRPTAAEAQLYQAPSADRTPRSSQKEQLMLLRENVALYLKGVYPTTETVDQETKKRVVLEFFIQPFTQELAQSLDVAGNLFTRSNGDPIDDIVACELAIAVPLQQMTMRMAPDSPGGRTFSDVRVAKTIKVRRDKEGPILAATIKVDFAYPAPDDLLYLFNGYLDQHYVTFETQQGSLGLSEPAPDAPPKRRGRKPATTEAEPTIEEVQGPPASTDGDQDTGSSDTVPAV